MLVGAIKKDVQLLLRDRGSLITLFLLPVVFIGVFGAIFARDGGVDRRTLAVWAAPRPLPSAVVAAIAGSQLFEIRRFASADLVRDEVAAARVDVGLVLVDDFDPGGGRPAELVIDEALAAQVRAPLEGTLTAIVRAAVFPPRIGGEAPVVVIRSPPGIRPALPGASAFQMTVPGNAVLFGFFLALTVGLAFTEERRSGTWQRILAAPVPRATLLAAKLVPYFLIGLGQFVFLFGVGVGVFGMRIGGSLLALALLTTAVVACTTTLGLLFAAVGGTEKRLGSIGAVSLLIMGLIGGAMVPRAMLPPTMKIVGLLVPHGWALDGYATLLVRDGAGLRDVAPQLAALFGFAGAFALVGAWRFRFEPR